MGWHSNQLKMALGLGGVFSFYGIVALISFIVPYPRLGYTERTIILVAIVLITLPFFLLFGFLMSRRKKKKEAAAAEASASAASNGDAAAAAQAQPSAPAGSYSALTAGAEEAVQFLKTSNLGSAGQDAVYGLPWYIVAGAPRSGKSSRA